MLTPIDPKAHGLAAAQLYKEGRNADLYDKARRYAERVRSCGGWKSWR